MAHIEVSFIEKLVEFIRAQNWDRGTVNEHALRQFIDVDLRAQFEIKEPYGDFGIHRAVAEWCKNSGWDAGECDQQVLADRLVASQYTVKLKAPPPTETNDDNTETNAASSDTSAASGETNAASGETNAASGETNAASGETNAASGETNAASGETNAASGETNAASGETNAASGETNAASGETEPSQPFDVASVDPLPTGDSESSDNAPGPASG